MPKDDCSKVEYSWFCYEIKYAERGVCRRSKAGKRERDWLLNPRDVFGVADVAAVGVARISKHDGSFYPVVFRNAAECFCGFVCYLGVSVDTGGKADAFCIEHEVLFRTDTVVFSLHV